MRFVHRIANIVYTVRPSQSQWDPNGIQKPPTPPIHARFSKHYFDTEVAERTERWAPSVRESVEQYLLNHGDMNGGGMYVEGLAPENVTATAEEREQEAGCIASVTNPTDSTTVLCGRRPVLKEGFCIEHTALFLGAEATVERPKPEPEPEPEPEPVPIQAATSAEAFPCGDCDKVFDKAQGLRMHRMKVHEGQEVRV